MIRLLALGLLISSFPAFAAITVGKIDLQKAITLTALGKRNSSKLKGEFDRKAKDLKKVEEEIKTMQKSFQDQASVLSDKARRKKEGEMQRKMLDYQKKTVDYQKEIRDMEKSLMGPILKKMRPIVSKVSKAAKVDLTVEASTASVLYASKEVDLTSIAAKEFDKQHPAKKK